MCNFDLTALAGYRREQVNPLKKMPRAGMIAGPCGERRPTTIHEWNDRLPHETKALNLGDL